MLRKNIRFLYGGGIVLLLVSLVVIYNYYLNSPPQDPVIIYKVTRPTEQMPKQKKTPAIPEVQSQPETDPWDDAGIEDQPITETAASEEKNKSEQEGFVDFSAPQPTTQLEEPPQEDLRTAVLKEIFPKLDKLQREMQELLVNIKVPIDPSNVDPRWHTLEAKVQEYCWRIEEQFPGVVSFFTFQGEKWAYEIDFRILQDSLKSPVPPELEGYFRYEGMREMFGLPDISQEQLQQIQ